MRFLTRLHACLAALICFILYFSWRQPSIALKDSVLQTVLKGSAHRLVVFGDDWSDTGIYRVSPPEQSITTSRDPDRGELWTEALCKELECDFIDNFARSIPSNVNLTTFGSLVDLDVYANATVGGDMTETLALFDFKTQVQRFIDFEEQKQQIPARLRKVSQWTIFTVFFGLWDLLKYFSLEKGEALCAIDKSVESMFHSLDVLAEHASDPIRVVFPKLVDVSFLPLFQSQKNETAGFAQNHHQLVYLSAYWNAAMSQTAARWQKGGIFMPDVNTIVVDRVRERQLYSKPIGDASEDSQRPFFDDVERPCLSLKTGKNSPEPHATEMEKCFDPARHLFWDKMHFSGAAHQLIGKEAARLVQQNDTVNADAQTRATPGPITGQGKGEKHAAGFKLKLPPGY